MWLKMNFTFCLSVLCIVNYEYSIKIVIFMNIQKNSSYGSCLIVLEKGKQHTYQFSFMKLLL